MRTHGEQYRRTHHPCAAQQKVMRHVVECRTAALGGHTEQCDGCGQTRVCYNSCRDRHCPKCQSTARAEWLEARLNRLLPVPYFHVVFTLPQEINALALAHPKMIFDLLFHTAAATLLQIAADPKHLGAHIGFTAVLHTWGQNLLFHPHLHCVVTGGGLSPDGQRWVTTRKQFFLPVKVLSRLFRGKFLGALQTAYLAGQLHFAGSTAELQYPACWRRWLAALYRKPWVVYAKPPFAGPEQIFRYLGRYTHRVAISNHRLVAFHRGRVSFIVKDYTAAGKSKLLTLDAVEFIRRFLLHVLPKGYTRIRHFGLCAGRNLSTKLGAARRLLPATTFRPHTVSSTDPAQRPWWQRFLDRTGIDLLACPRCASGRFVRQRDIPPLRSSYLPAIRGVYVTNTS